MDFIVTYCECWETSLRTSKHHYIERLAADGHRVLYVEVPANPMSMLARFSEFKSQVLPRIRAGVEKVADNIWVMTGFVPLPYHPALWGIFDQLFVNQLNQRVFLPRLNAAQEKLRFKAPILLSYYPFVFPIIKEVGVSFTVFHMVDEWQGMAGIPRSMAKLTQAMLKHADVTIVTSSRLYERYKLSAKRIELLRHGTDLSLFEPVSKGSVTPDSRMQAFIGTKIGYYGALHKLDVEIIVRAAEARPNWTFVFVGPMVGARGVRQQDTFPPNVHFFGEMPHASLPEFLAGLDSFWMPFVVNELTRSMSPIKMSEVLSAGLPIVTSDLDECRAMSGSLALFARNVDEHLAQLERSISMRSPKETKLRVEAMRDYDWNNRYKEFSKLLQR